MLVQIILGLADNETRVKFLEACPGLTFDQAVAVVRTVEMPKLQAEQIQPGGAVQALRKSIYKKAKSNKVPNAAAATKAATKSDDA